MHNMVCMQYIHIHTYMVYIYMIYMAYISCAYEHKKTYIIVYVWYIFLLTKFGKLSKLSLVLR